MVEASIATMTYDKGSYTESSVILKSLSVLSKLGIPINCVHGGMLPETETGLKKLGVNVSTQKESGLGSAINQTMKEAYNKGADIVVYTEPNKHPIFWPQLSKVIEPIKNNEADITFASRDPDSFETYPFNRKTAERWFNLIASSVTGVSGDYVFGTKAFRREVVPTFDEFFKKYQKNNWVELMGSTFSAMNKGYKAKMVTINAPALEEEQKEIEPSHTKYRVSQGLQNLEGLLIGYNKMDALESLTNQFRELLEDEFTKVSVTYL